MATGQLNGVIDKLRQSAMLRDDDGLTDGQLLEAFLVHADETAYAAIVRRHAAMVWGVCIRTLGHAQDAEDAFQATFLVLVKRANAIWPREMVGNWLHGVAYRTALKAKSLAMKRRAREKQVDEMPAQEVHDEKIWHDLRPLLDRELNRLADKYRVPVVLCDLEGKSQREAARQLGWPEGTLTTRLTRARQMLAKRLTRHGLALSAGGLALVISQNAVSACAPAPLVVSTIKAASLFAAGQAATSVTVAALTEGVLQAMFLTKLKSVMMIVAAIALVATGGGILGHRVLADRTVPAGQPPVVQQVDFDDEFTFFQERGEQGERRPAVNPPAFSGRVVAVAKDAKSITIETPSPNRGEAPVKQEVKLTDKTKLTFSGVGTGGAKIAEGLAAQVWLADGTKDTAASVSFLGSEQMRRSADVFGKVVKVGKDTVSVETMTRNRGENAKIVDVKLVASTHLTFGNISAGGAKITEGYQANVWFAKGSKDTAASVNFSGNQGTDRARPAPRTDPVGKVVGISKDGKSITVEMPPANRGDEPTKVDYKIDAKTEVHYHNVGLDGAKLKEGYFARVLPAGGAKDTAGSLDLFDTPKDRNNVLRSKVTSVSKDGKSFTVEVPPTERGGEARTVTVKITAETRVAYMGVGLNGAQLTEGYAAEVWLEEGSMTDAVQVLLRPATVDGRRN